MDLIIEFLKSNQRLLYAVVFVFGLVIFYVLIRFFAGKAQNDDLNRDLNSREDCDDLEEDDEEKPKGRFFVIESYCLPDDWEETFDVIVDRQTRVQYLNYGDYGITPLIDSDGKPILYKDDDEEQEESV